MTSEIDFLKNVAKHEMTIISEDGVHRHIRFKKPDSSDMFFDLITWPGSLCYTGDMGTYVFRRLTDMFEFFRMREYDLAKNRQGGLSINRSYWGEKLEAIDSCDGYKKYSQDKFCRVVSEIRLGWIREGGLSKEERRELWDAVKDDVLYHADDGEDSARRAAVEFNHKTSHETFNLNDFWEHDLTDYTHRFTWCCYALAWGIKQYDQSKTTESATA